MPAPFPEQKDAQYASYLIPDGRPPQDLNWPPYWQNMPAERRISL